jgi:tetratricopeptide (TPR) repeat protein
MQAGDNAMTVSAGLEAEAHYSQAVALATGEGSELEVRRRAKAYARRAGAHVFLGKPDAAVGDLRHQLSCASEIGDADIAFDARHSLVYLLALAERPDESAQAMAELERSFEQSPDMSKRLRLLNLGSQLLKGRGELDQAAVVADHALASARSVDDRGRLMVSLSIRAQLDFYRAEYESALPALREVCEDVTPAEHRSELVITRSQGTLFLGLTLGNLGRFSEALAALQAGLGAARRDGYAYWISRLLNAMGWLYGELGMLDAALQLNEEALAESQSHDVEVRAQSGLNLAADCLRLGFLDRVPSLLQSAETFAKKSSWLGWHARIQLSCLAAEYWLAQGQPTRAAEFGREGDVLARRHGAWKYAVLGAKALADAEAAQGHWAEAHAQLQTAVDVLTTHPVPLIAWRVHAARSQLYEQSGEHRQAAAAIEMARAEVYRLADTIAEVPLKTSFLGSRAVRAVLDDEATISEHPGY